MHISSQLSVLMIGSLKLFMVNTFINIYIIEINKAATPPLFYHTPKSFYSIIQDKDNCVIYDKEMELLLKSNQITLFIFGHYSLLGCDSGPKVLFWFCYLCHLI